MQLVLRIGIDVRVLARDLDREYPGWPLIDRHSAPEQNADPAHRNPGHERKKEGGA